MHKLATIIATATLLASPFGTPIPAYAQQGQTSPSMHAPSNPDVIKRLVPQNILDLIPNKAKDYPIYVMYTQWGSNHDKHPCLNISSIDRAVCDGPANLFDSVNREHNQYQSWKLTGEERLEPEINISYERMSRSERSKIKALPEEQQRIPLYAVEDLRKTYFSEVYEDSGYIFNPTSRDDYYVPKVKYIGLPNDYQRRMASNQEQYIFMQQPYAWKNPVTGEKHIDHNRPMPRHIDSGVTLPGIYVLEDPRGNNPLNNGVLIALPAPTIELIREVGDWSTPFTGIKPVVLSNPEGIDTSKITYQLRADTPWMQTGAINNASTQRLDAAWSRPMSLVEANQWINRYLRLYPTAQVEVAADLRPAISQDYINQIKPAYFASTSWELMKNQSIHDSHKYSPHGIGNTPFVTTRISRTVELNDNYYLGATQNRFDPNDFKDPFEVLAVKDRVNSSYPKRTSDSESIYAMVGDSSNYKGRTSYRQPLTLSLDRVGGSFRPPANTELVKIVATWINTDKLPGPRSYDHSHLNDISGKYDDTYQWVDHSSPQPLTSQNASHWISRESYQDNDQLLLPNNTGGSGNEDSYTIQPYRLNGHIGLGAGLLPANSVEEALGKIRYLSSQQPMSLDPRFTKEYDREGRYDDVPSFGGMLYVFYIYEYPVSVNEDQSSVESNKQYAVFYHVERESSQPSTSPKGNPINMVGNLGDHEKCTFDSCDMDWGHAIHNFYHFDNGQHEMIPKEIVALKSTRTPANGIWPYINWPFYYQEDGTSFWIRNNSIPYSFETIYRIQPKNDDQFWLRQNRYEVGSHHYRKEDSEYLIYAKVPGRQMFAPVTDTVHLDPSSQDRSIFRLCHECVRPETPFLLDQYRVEGVPAGMTLLWPKEGGTDSIQLEGDLDLITQPTTIRLVPKRPEVVAIPPVTVVKATPNSQNQGHGQGGQPPHQGSQPSHHQTPPDKPQLVPGPPNPSPKPAPFPVWDQLYGSSRHETTTNVFGAIYPQKAKAVFVTRDDNSTDALLSLPVAVRDQMPVLQTNPDQLSPATATYLREQVEAKSPVIIVGGYTAVSAGVEAKLIAMGHPVSRIGGATRVETAHQFVAWSGLDPVKSRNYELDDQSVVRAAVAGRSLSFTEGGPIPEILVPVQDHRPGDRVTALVYSAVRWLRGVRDSV